MNPMRTAAFLALALPCFSQSVLVVITKDGQQHRFNLADVARIEFANASPAPPPPPPPPHGNWMDAFTGGKVLSGEARQGSKAWPCRIRMTNHSKSTGAFTGEVTWTSLNSIHRIQGKLSGSALSFTETEAIRAGGAHLHVSYTLTISTSGARGKWTDPSDHTSGDMAIFAQ